MSELEDLFPDIDFGGAEVIKSEVVKVESFRSVITDSGDIVELNPKKHTDEVISTGRSIWHQHPRRSARCERRRGR